MKRRSLLFIGLSLALTAVLIGAAGCEAISPSSNAPASSATSSQQSTGIWVSGEGKVSVVPDVAILSLGVEAQAATVGEAQSQAATAMDAVMRELTSHGTAKKDIQTQHFSISPVRKWVPEKEEEVLIGYRVDNTITARIRNVEDTGVIIDAVAAAGGDNIRINNISFTVDDPTPYYEEVRKEAMADAGAKARQLADAGDVKLGKPIYINESGGYISTPPPVPAYAPALGGASPTTPISPGETEIRLTVQVVYEIR